MDDFSFRGLRKCLSDFVFVGGSNDTANASISDPLNLKETVHLRKIVFIYF